MISEFIYRLMDSPEKLEMLKKFNLYSWNGDENLNSMNFNDYVAEFFQFKIKFDDYNKSRIMGHYPKDNNATTTDYRKLFGYGNKLSKLYNKV